MEFNEKIIAEYARKYQEGMSFSQIRQELAQRGFDGDTVTTIISFIDDMIITTDIHKSLNGNRTKRMKLIGLLLLLGGGIVSLGTYFGYIEIMKGYYIFTFLPVVGGYLLYRTARNKENKE